jgi:hypothetical protein
MAGRLPAEVVHDEAEAGLLQVGSHPAAHGAQPDESHDHAVLRHFLTLLWFPGFRRQRNTALPQL